MKSYPIDKAGICRVLVIKPRAIGDVLLSTAILPNLRRELPDAQIDFVVESFASPVLERNPYIDNIVTYDTRRDSSLSIISKVRRRHYDLVIDLFANPRTAVITLLSGARHRIGFPFKWRRIAYNIIVTPRSGEVHNVQFNLDAIRRLGFKVDSVKPGFYLDEESLRFGETFLEENGLQPNEFFAINIGGGWSIKRWPVDKFIDLCGMIRERLRRRVVVLYGPSEEKEASRISRASGEVFAPRTSLKEMGGILRLSRALVTNDSGPMHIAAALDVPTLAIFGPTTPRLQGPYGNVSEIVRNGELDCLGCNLTRCTIGNLCMQELEVETVFEHLQSLLTKLARSRDTAAVNR